LYEELKIAIKLNYGFESLRFSDLNYEEITVEIKYKGEAIAQINKDKDPEMLEIEIYTGYAQPDFVPKFGLSDLLEALNEAKKLLQD
jgi:predicted enzyme involved in methoxymalonyl-ACP biosynthesis